MALLPPKEKGTGDGAAGESKASIFPNPSPCLVPAPQPLLKPQILLTNPSFPALTGRAYVRDKVCQEFKTLGKENFRTL